MFTSSLDAVSKLVVGPKLEAISDVSKDLSKIGGNMVFYSCNFCVVFA